MTMSNANTSASTITHSIPEVQAALRHLADTCLANKTAVFIGVADVDADGDKGLGAHCVASPEFPLNRRTLLHAVASA